FHSSCLHDPSLLTDPPHSATPTLSLHDALPIFSTASNFARKTRYFVTSPKTSGDQPVKTPFTGMQRRRGAGAETPLHRGHAPRRSEEHTSELQSPDHLVCRLLLEKKKTRKHKKL